MMTPEQVKQQREELLDQLAEVHGAVNVIVAQLHTLQTRCKHPKSRLYCEHPQSRLYCEYCGFVLDNPTLPLTSSIYSPYLKRLKKAVEDDVKQIREGDEEDNV